VVSLVVMAQVLLVLEDLVAVLALEDVVVLVSLLVPLPGKEKPVERIRIPEDPYVFGPPGSGSISTRYRTDLDPDPSIIKQK
jgi:hypothetical protein